MSRFYTIMIIPEREKGVRSFKVPRVIFNGIIFIIFLVIAVAGILSYDYIKILKQVYENRHLSIENRQLKEQIQLFNMKLNTITEDMERVQLFEKKLKVITGYEDFDLKSPVKENTETNTLEEHDGHDHSRKDTYVPPPKAQDNPLYITDFKKVFSEDEIVNKQEYIDIKNLYERRIATNFGLITGYSYTKEWNSLIKQSLGLADIFAKFDFKFSTLRTVAKELETSINKLDQFLIDRESLLRSTPSLLPSRGWITSYYGPRVSHYSKRVKMHEGLDVGAPIGTPVIAPADGIIKVAGKNPGFGYYVEIDHGYGVETLYAHNSKLHVKKGQLVKRGDLIARVGNTGLSTGPHLHYEVRVNGTPVDPLYYILD